VLRLKFLEDSCDPAALEGEKGFYEGEKWSHLLGWYLRQYEQDFENEEQLLAKQKVISQVIRRMIKHEASIMVVVKDTEGYNNLPNEEKLLRLHPSYQA
jgi:20S proteasome alpha/beta subunit